MPNKKISELPLATDLQGGELLPIVQGGETKQTTIPLTIKPKTGTIWDTKYNNTQFRTSESPPERTNIVLGYQKFSNDYYELINSSEKIKFAQSGWYQISAKFNLFAQSLVDNIVRGQCDVYVGRTDDTANPHKMFLLNRFNYDNQHATNKQSYIQQQAVTFTFTEYFEAEHKLGFYFLTPDIPTELKAGVNTFSAFGQSLASAYVKITKLPI